MEVVIGGKIRVLHSIKQDLRYVDTEEGKLFELEKMIVEGEMSFPCIVFLQDKRRVYSVY